MHYFDTSFLTPLIREEKTSSLIEQFVAELPVGQLAISRWTEVEFASLMARDVRIGIVGRDEARQADALFGEAVRDSFVVFLPSADDYDLARRFLQRYETGLRAGDALHLAIAGNRDVKAVYTLDHTMLSAGQVLGLPVSTGIPSDER